MTEEEADYGDEYFTEHLPKVDPSKGGVTSRQSFRIIGELARKIAESRGEEFTEAGLP